VSGLDAKTLFRKSVAKAIKSPGNLITGAVSLAASAVLWNPLPLILWTLGASGWVAMSATGQRYAKVIAAEEWQKQLAQAQAERERLRQSVESSLQEPPFLGWLRGGAIPDYPRVYSHLVDVRERVARVLRERKEAAELADTGILGQLDYLLGTFLRFVQERLIYLQILANVRPNAPDGGALPPPPPAPARLAGPRAAIRAGAAPVAPRSPAGLPSVEVRLDEVDAKMAQLKELAASEPATAKTREWHIGILQKQRDLLLECQKRDQCVVAQLGAFADVFEVILGRVSASQLSAPEIASYMGSVVEQIVETERMVESLRPAMDELMGGLDMAGAQWAAPVRS
jgi:hypothetical protein